MSDAVLYRERILIGYVQDHETVFVTFVGLQFQQELEVSRLLKL